MSRGLLELLSSATLLLFAIPPAYAGLDLLLGGNLFFGVALLGVALGMVVGDQYITTPSDLSVLVASKVVDAVVKTPDEE